MAEAGYETTGVQCRDKLKNLKNKYRKLKTTKAKQAEEGRHGNSMAAHYTTNQILDQHS